MKKIMLPVLIFLLLMVSTTSVNADIGGLPGSTVLSVSLVNYDPNPAISGNVVEVRFGVENIGGTTVNDIMFEVVPEYPFELVSGENAVQKIGIIPGYQVDSTENIKVIKYRMQINKDAPAGSYELKVKYYQQGIDAATQKSLSLDIKSRQNAEVIHIDKTALVPGKQSSLKFTINNVGSAPLQDLTFNWENTNNIILPVGSDNTKYINYIDIGQGAELEYQVIADTNAQPGLYKLNLYLTYGDSLTNKTNKISTFAGIYVGGGTDFDVAFSDNANGQISFSVANIGSNPANSVSVVVPDQNIWSVTGSNAVIIGNLNKGDYTVASFKLQSSIGNMSSQNRGSRNNSNSMGRPMQRSINDSSNNSPDTVLIQISYTDTMGERKVVDKQVKIASNTGYAGSQSTFQGRGSTATQVSVFSTYQWYFIGIGALVAVFLAWRKYKSAKLIDPDFKMKDIFRSEKK